MERARSRRARTVSVWPVPASPTATIATMRPGRGAAPTGTTAALARASPSTATPASPSTCAATSAPRASRASAAARPRSNPAAGRTEGCVRTGRDDAADSPQQGRRRQQPQARRRLARHGVLLLGAAGARLRRPLQPQCPDGRAQDAALRHPRARHAHGQRALGRGQDQRPRALCRRPHHRPVEGGRQRDRHDGRRASLASSWRCWASNLPTSRLDRYNGGCASVRRFL